MTEPTKNELEAQLAAMQQQMDALRARLQAQEDIATTPTTSAEGDRSLAAGRDVHDNVIMTGDRNAYLGTVETVSIASAIFQAPPAVGQTAPKELLWTYLNQVVRDTGTLDLAGVDRYAATEQDDAQLELAAVYTALDTVRAADDRGRMSKRQSTLDLDMQTHERQSALAFVNQGQNVVLLGDPGSGKTTFVRFVALCLAGEMLQLKQANLARLAEEWAIGTQLPIIVVLRDFAAQLPQNSHGNAGEQLWAFIVQRMGQALASFGPLLQKHLLEEGGLLILDGLDEVPAGQHQRETVQQAVLDFGRQFPRARILLTSRTYAYQQPEWQLPGFADAVLAPFNTEQIALFVDGWYAHMAQVRPGVSAREAAGRAALLKGAIARSIHLQDLAQRPLLLTLMASLHAWRGGSLPDQREQLYEESVELLLDIWERPKIHHDEDGQPRWQNAGVAAWLNAPQQRIQQALEKLAFEAHHSQEARTGAADIAEAELVMALLRAADDPDLHPTRVQEYISDRAGLLINRGQGVYSFPHRTFQEYMAARHLSSVGFPTQLVRLVQEDAERWREVLLLAGAKVTRGTPYAGWTLVSKLCPTAAVPTAASGIASVDTPASDAAWWTALLAGRLLVETGIYRGLDPAVDVDDAATLTRVQTWLTALVNAGHLPPVDRASAGVALGHLGDQRRGVGVQDGLPDIDWKPIEAGPFTMGNNDDTDPEAYEDEQPQFTCTLLQQPYRISRYPITVAQFQRFVAAGGYTIERYWTQAGWQWRQAENITKPNAYGGDFDAPNHPQVGISWYEAVAFCAWLSAVGEREVRLPTEAEWERAARHTDGRVYPWGDAFDPSRCNMDDTSIGATSAVGIFPSGNAVCGATDMAGNVWEWCSTKWLDTYEDYAQKVDDSLAGDDRRVLRGGAFNYDRYNVRCAYRNNYDPHGRVNYVGLRVVSPGL